MRLVFESWRRFLKEEAKQDLKGQTIILIGDSQMLGGDKKWRNSGFAHPRVKGSSWGRRHMGGFLKQALEARGAKVYKFARGGWGSKSWNGQLKNKKFLEKLTTLKPSQVIVNLGQNDTKRGDSYFKDYTAPLMQNLKKISSNITWFGPSHVSSDEKKQSAFKIANEKLGSYAGLAKIKYVNMLNWATEGEALKGNPIKTYDKAHFRGEAAKRWANAISSKISVPTLVAPKPPVAPETTIQDPLEMPEPFPPAGIEQGEVDAQ